MPLLRPKVVLAFINVEKLSDSQTKMKCFERKNLFHYKYCTNHKKIHDSKTPNNHQFLNLKSSYYLYMLQGLTQVNLQGPCGVLKLSNKCLRTHKC